MYSDVAELYPLSSYFFSALCICSVYSVHVFSFIYTLYTLYLGPLSILQGRKARNVLLPVITIELGQHATVYIVSRSLSIRCTAGSSPCLNNPKSAECLQLQLPDASSLPSVALRARS